MNRFLFNTMLIAFMLIIFSPNIVWAKKSDDLQLRSDIAIVWPLVQTVKIEYELTLAQLEFLKTEAEKKSFLADYEQFVKDKYFKQVLELNIRQMKLLLLLINRELGETPFNLLKEFRSLSRALYWQRLARLAGFNLRDKYDPATYPEIENEIRIIKLVVSKNK
jgi:hypothetical protein